MEEDTEEREDNNRRKSEEKAESLSYVTDAIKGANMMTKKRAQSERGLPGCCQNEDSNHK